MSKSKSDFVDIDHLAIFDTSRDAIFILNADGRILAANRTAEKRYGYSLNELKKMTASDLAPADLKNKVTPKLKKILKSGEIFEWRHRCKDGTEMPVEINTQPVTLHGETVLVSMVRDISSRKQLEAELQNQQQLLEMIATGDPLPVTLAALVRFVEDQSPGMLGSVLLLDKDGVHVRHGAAPNLPAEFVAAIDGQSIGPVAGSCGTAAYRRQAVFVDDIATDPLWAVYKAAALPHGLRACWSTPIFDVHGKVLGTFAMYYRQPGLPTPEHLQLIDTATHIAAIAIGRYQAEKTLHFSKARLIKAQHVAHMGFLEWNLKTNEILCSDEVYEMYGIERPEVATTPDFVGKLVHPDDLELVQSNLDMAVKRVKPYDIDHRIKRPDGRIIWVHAQAELINDPDDNTEILLGTVVDITARKLAEAAAQRLTHIYAALSQCNKSIVRCSSEAELFPQICRDAVEFGGMKMAWIGLTDPASKRVRPVASCGAGIEYLDGIEISVDANDPAGRGPVGTSIRENRPIWFQDFQHDPNSVVWHERAAKFGWGAVASLPLHRKGATIGSYNLYACDKNAFDEQARDLLVDMVMDVSYALDHFASENERKKTEEALRVSEHQLRTIIETEPECVKILGGSGNLVDINAAGLALLEVETLQEARQHDLVDFIVPEYRDAFRTLYQRVMEGEKASLEFEITGLKGTRRWVETSAAPLRDGSGETTSLLGITRDITERKRAEQQITLLANFDALTGLPNRAQLDSHLKYALSLVKRSNGNLAVMFIDIDHFKDINDTLGHSIGDSLLIEVAKRLQSVLREEDTASRLGGDEFMLILPDADARGAAQVAQKLLQVVSEPYQIEQYDLVVTASIGVALYPNDGENLESLSKSADTAMYRAKQEGRNDYRFFTPAMQARAARNMQLVNALRYALELGQFEVHYQPQVTIPDRRIIGIETLLRWRHPELGNVSPAEFIPVAEDSGLILPIGEWVLRTAVKQLKSWMDSGYAPIIIAVNLSAVQFRHPSLSELVSSILEETQLPGKYLELELTEGVTMHDPQRAIAIMDTLDERGIRMSIDDFGTGYSSLNYLKKFKAYKLKIDQSFVRDIITDHEDRAIVAAIISMAKSLELQTIAEGVETAEQLAYLVDQGCDEAQGYYFSKPLTAADVEPLIARGTL